MTRKIVLIAVTFVASSLLAQGAWAQLFGERTLGRGRPASGASTTRTTSRASSAKAAAGAKPAAGATEGSLISEECGLSAETVRRLISSAPARVRRGGLWAASRLAGRPQKSARRSTICRSRRHRTRIRRPGSQNALMPMNAPRLRIDFEFAPQVATAVSDRLSRRLQAASPRAGTSRIEVSVAGDVAILRGVVASARDRKLAELLVGFEPGIAAVKNQLVVRPADSPPPLPPPVRDSSSLPVVARSGLDPSGCRLPAQALAVPLRCATPRGAGWLAAVPRRWSRIAAAASSAVLPPVADPLPAPRRKLAGCRAIRRGRCLAEANRAADPCPAILLRAGWGVRFCRFWESCAIRNCSAAAPLVRQRHVSPSATGRFCHSCPRIASAD